MRHCWGNGDGCYFIKNELCGKGYLLKDTSSGKGYTTIKQFSTTHFLRQFLKPS